MRWVTFKIGGEARLGAQVHGGIVDVQNAHCLRSLYYSGAAAAERGRLEVPADLVAVLTHETSTRAAREAVAFVENAPEAAWELLEGQTSILYRPDQVQLLSPVLRPPKVICLGLNYRDHAEESGMAVPQEPVVFTKYATAIVGPDAPIVLPPTSEQVDYEAELVFVIGRSGRDIPEADAERYVAGYTCGNDVSARDYQLKRGGGQWTIGKTFDSFAPLGPALVTPDELGDPHSLPIRCILNGETMQDSTTSQLVFRIPQIIAYLSHVMTLEVGDVVFTGTPPGVGFARKPPVFLKPGDEVEIRIDGVGTLRNPVKAG